MASQQTPLPGHVTSVWRQIRMTARRYIAHNTNNHPMDLHRDFTGDHDVMIACHVQDFELRSTAEVESSIGSKARESETSFKVRGRESEVEDHCESCDLGFGKSFAERYIDRFEKELIKKKNIEGCGKGLAEKKILDRFGKGFTGTKDIEGCEKGPAEKKIVDRFGKGSTETKDIEGCEKGLAEKKIVDRFGKGFTGTKDIEGCGKGSAETQKIERFGKDLIEKKIEKKRGHSRRRIERPRNSHTSSDCEMASSQKQSTKLQSSSFNGKIREDESSVFVNAGDDSRMPPVSERSSESSVSTVASAEVPLSRQHTRMLFQKNTWEASSVGTVASAEVPLTRQNTCTLFQKNKWEEESMTSRESVETLEETGESDSGRIVLEDKVSYVKDKTGFREQEEAPAIWEGDDEDEDVDVVLDRRTSSYASEDSEDSDDDASMGSYRTFTVLKRRPHDDDDDDSDGSMSSIDDDLDQTEDNKVHDERPVPARWSRRDSVDKDESCVLGRRCSESDLSRTCLKTSSTEVEMEPSDEDGESCSGLSRKGTFTVMNRSEYFKTNLMRKGTFVVLGKKAYSQEEQRYKDLLRKGTFMVLGGRGNTREEERGKQGRIPGRMRGSSRGYEGERVEDEVKASGKKRENSRGYEGGKQGRRGGPTWRKRGDSREEEGKGWKMRESSRGKVGK